MTTPAAFAALETTRRVLDAARHRGRHLAVGGLWGASSAILCASLRGGLGRARHQRRVECPAHHQLLYQLCATFLCNFHGLVDTGDRTRDDHLTRRIEVCCLNDSFDLCIFAEV